MANKPKGTKLRKPEYFEIKRQYNAGAKTSKLQKTTQRSNGVLTMIKRSKSYPDYCKIRDEYIAKSRANQAKAKAVEAPQERAVDELQTVPPVIVKTAEQAPTQRTVSMRHGKVFNRHKWTTWRMPIMGVLHTIIGDKKAEYQERNCTKCNLVQRRTI